MRPTFQCSDLTSRKHKRYWEAHLNVLSSETATDRATPSESGTPAKKRGRPRKQSTSEEHQGSLQVWQHHCNFAHFFLLSFTSFKMLNWPHIKWYTRRKPTIFGPVFLTLSHGVIHFVASVSFKKHWIEANDWRKQIWTSQRVIFLTLATKLITPHERVWKNVPENGVFSCVPFCFEVTWAFW